MTKSYDEMRNEMGRYFNLVKKEDKWAKVFLGSAAAYGKIHEVGNHLLYLNPSLVWEESPKKTGFRLEDKIPTMIPFNSISGNQVVSQDCIDNLIEENKEKRTGFG